MADTPNASGEPDELYLDAAATEPVPSFFSSV